MRMPWTVYGGAWTCFSRARKLVRKVALLPRLQGAHDPLSASKAECALYPDLRVSFGVSFVWSSTQTGDAERVWRTHVAVPLVQPA